MKTTIKQWRARIRFQDERGIGLIEVLVAIAILAIATTAFTTGLSTGSIAVREGNQGVVAQSLVQAQLEYVKSYPYDSEATAYPGIDTYDETYNPDPITLPDGYVISVGVVSIPDTDTDIQKIMVTISRDGEDILTVENCKVNR